MNASRPSPYTFGDSDLAGQRLELLSRIYEQPSRSFLRRLTGVAADLTPHGARPGRATHDRPRLAIDLGCGPGHTTRMLHAVVGAERTVGIDNSAAHLRRARTALEAAGREHHAAPGEDGAGAIPATGVSYLDHDLRVTPFPLDAPADVVFARFILTHLADPGRVLRGWSQLLRDGGVLLLQETTSLACDHPAFSRYYELVGALQRLHGQSLYIGRELADLARSVGLNVFHAEEARFERTAADMAEVHLMNLRSWRADEQARQAFAPQELDLLENTLDEIRVGAIRCPPVLVGLAEVGATLAPGVSHELVSP